MEHILLTYVEAIPKCQTHHFNLLRLWVSCKNGRDVDTALLKNNFWEKTGIKDISPVLSETKKKKIAQPLSPRPKEWPITYASEKQK